MIAPSLTDCCVVLKWTEMQIKNISPEGRYTHSVSGDNSAKLSRENRASIFSLSIPLLLQDTRKSLLCLLVLLSCKKWIPSIFSDNCLQNNKNISLFSCTPRSHFFSLKKIACIISSVAPNQPEKLGVENRRLEEIEGQLHLLHEGFSCCTALLACTCYSLTSLLCITNMY